MRAGPGRTYRFFQGDATFPFGHGLTYTSFTMEWVAAGLPTTTQTVKEVESGLSFQVRVANTGSRRGAKVVAGYVKVAATGLPQDGPLKQLFAMEKVMLEPGTSAVVTLRSNGVPHFNPILTQLYPTLTPF